MEKRFDRAVVLITGAGTGIGRAVARAFVEEGAQVGFVGRRQETLEQAAAGLPAEQVELLACDVSRRQAVNAAIGQVEERFGSIGILVNNAGINTMPRSVAEVAPEDWDATININLTGAFNCVRAVLPGMRRQRDGLVINVSSISGLRPSKLAGAPYSASKHGVVALTSSLNEEEAEFGIRACAICPGEVDTPLLDQRPQPIGPEARLRILQPDDVAAAALFVAALPPRACIPLLVIKPTTQVFQ
jgi:NAD(P)-dependent dehydrogenase (short-subunit alcohol dehydrogenase family)